MSKTETVPAPPRVAGTRRRFVEVGGFFVGSLSGVVVDLVAFAVLSFLGVSPSVSNFVSSSLAICITYQIVTKLAYNMDRSPRSFIVFVCWYALSIAAFSALIGLATDSFHAPPIAAKIASLPFSFGVNFLFTKLLLTRVRDFELRRLDEGPRRVGPAPRYVNRVLVVLVTLALVISGALLALRGSLTSDSLLLDHFAHDLFAEGGRWSDWRLTPAAAYFPDMVLYFAGYFLFDNAIARTAFVSVLQWVALAGTLTWLTGLLLPRQTVARKSLTLIAFGVFTVITARTDIWVFFYSTNNHFASVLFPLIAIAAAMAFVKSGRKRWLVIIVLSGVAGQLSTSIYLLVFAVPVCVVIVVLCVLLRGRQWRLDRRRLILILASVALGTIAAYAIAKVITFNDPGAGRTVFSTDGLLNSVRAMILATRYAFNSGSGLLTLLSLAVTAPIVYLIVRLMRSPKVERDGSGARTSIQWVMDSEDEGVGRRVVLGGFGIVSLVTCSVGSLVSGGFVDIYGYRYFILPLAVVAVTALTTLVASASSEQAIRFAAFSTSVVLILAGVVSIGPVADGLGRNSAGLAARGADTATCLSALEEQGVDLQSGVADYWNARGVGDRMDPALNIVALLNNLEPFYWMSTRGPLTRPDSYPPTTYNFAILEPVGSGTQFDFTADTVGRLLPAPQNTYTCPNGLAVWTWSDNSLDDVVRGAVSLWSLTSGWTKRADFPAGNLPTQGDVDPGPDRTASGNPPGTFLTYGPYTTLPPGHYRLEVFYNYELEPGQVASSWDTGSFVTGPTTPPLCSGTLSPDADMAACDFDTAVELPGWEARIVYSGNGMLSVSHIRLAKTSGP